MSSSQISAHSRLVYNCVGPTTGVWNYKPCPKFEVSSTSSEPHLSFLFFQYIPLCASSRRLAKPTGGSLVRYSFLHVVRVHDPPLLLQVGTLSERPSWSPVWDEEASSTRGPLTGGPGLPYVIPRRHPFGGGE